ncbi:MAG TPA: TatD family hydrolase [Gemmatimonadales bacterium]|jgi:TatD DNase family protein
MIDSHCHLADPAFAADLEAVIGRAREAGVEGVVVVAEGLESSLAARALCAGRDGFWPTAGIHPHRASEFSDTVARQLQLLIADSATAGVGETGLDYHYDHSPRDQQRASFSWHLVMASATGKPAIVHARDADHDAAELIGQAPAGAKGVLHCFASGPELLEAGLARGWSVSFSGMITFKNWTERWAVDRLADDQILIETDAPFLAPMPHRGKRNEPAFVAHTAAKLAELRGTTLEHIASITRANAERLFRVKSPTAKT